MVAQRHRCGDETRTVLLPAASAGALSTLLYIGRLSTLRTDASMTLRVLSLA